MLACNFHGLFSAQCCCKGKDETGGGRRGQCWSRFVAFCDNVYLDFALLPIADIAISIPGTHSPMHTHTHSFREMCCVRNAQRCILLVLLCVSANLSVSRVSLQLHRHQHRHRHRQRHRHLQLQLLVWLVFVFAVMCCTFRHFNFELSIGFKYPRKQHNRIASCRLRAAEWDACPCLIFSISSLPPSPTACFHVSVSLSLSGFFCQAL